MKVRILKVSVLNQGVGYLFRRINYNMALKKRALVIGINYQGTKYSLEGCINDAVALRTLLEESFRYPKGDIHLMTDESKGRLLPTGDNIIHQLRELVKSIRRDGLDEVWISYSGHGTYMRDRSNEESDGHDELLCPLDYAIGGCISDDMINHILAEIPTTCRVVGLFDCCHSGTICDLQYNHLHTQIPGKTTTRRRRRRRLVKVGRRYRVRWVWEKVTDKGRARWKLQSVWANRRSKIRCPMITISGCRDSQTSAGLYYAKAKEWSGALTTAFIATIRKCEGDLTCVELSEGLNQQMKSQRLKQQPVLSTSYALDQGQVFYTNPKSNRNCIR